MSKTKSYLADLGEKIIANGYSIVPIRPGSKMPVGEGEKGGEWQKLRIDRPKLREILLASGTNFGVGILTYNAPLADLDIKDAALAQHMEDWVLQNVASDAVVRVGEWPKRGIPFRADGSFRKVTSAIFLDPSIPTGMKDGKVDDRKAQTRVEILGDGQQYVSRHVHPETGKPYEYPRGGAPEDLARDQLPLLTEDQAQAIVAEFERKADALGWQRKRRGTSIAPAGRQDDAMQRMLLDQPLPDIDAPAARAVLEALPPRDDYHGWLEIGFALHHQFEGGQDGLDLWHEHSEKGLDYDHAELERKWPGLGKDEGRKNVTFRTLIEAAKEFETKRVIEAMEDIRKGLAAATDLAALEKITRKVKKQELSVLALNAVVADVRAAYKRITGGALSMGDARRMVRREDSDNLVTPDWAEGWYWIEQRGVFYHHVRRVEVSKEGFNGSYDRKLLSKLDRLEGKALPDTHAADLALNFYEIPRVDGVMYLPGFGETFTVEHRDYVNGFSPGSVPAMPPISSTGIKMFGRVLVHLEHLIADERDRMLFLSWLAYVARLQGRVSWAPLLQGAEGDGKSYFMSLLAAMLGSANVRPISPQSLRADFNDYAQGALIGFVEEVRLQGHNRFEVINQMKPLITNATVDINPKGQKTFTTINTMSYVLTSNFQDAIPIAKGDSRFFPVMSRWQDEDKLRVWKAANPEYYPRLFETCEHGPAIRRLLVDEFTLHPDFNPGARAPLSASRGKMIEMAKSNEVLVIEDLLEDSTKADLSAELLNLTELQAGMAVITGQVPHQNMMNRALMELGFTSLGRLRGADGKKHRFFSKKPEMWGGEDGRGDRIRGWQQDDL